MRMQRKATPANAGAAYYNEAATFFNANKLVEANAAADKSIAADPKRGETYYIKASSLIPNANDGSKDEQIRSSSGMPRGLPNLS